ncbi:hypothetical protein MAMT_01832 [Methylacidimicrobium tartarophylax]|uniref:Uncharacterized protein n=1 Tax=Methylacidimicrobium tartarophylax TaxID=1041768 RepID=A0A5E6MER3_9BACT|nr:hypothetical protein MAMT_01832 [Methylacidimicrobium tartarophylax]
MTFTHSQEASTQRKQKVYRSWMIRESYRVGKQVKTWL